MSRIRDVHLRLDLTDGAERAAWRRLNRADSKKALVVRALRDLADDSEQLEETVSRDEFEALSSKLDRVLTILEEMQARGGAALQQRPQPTRQPREPQPAPPARSTPAVRPEPPVVPAGDDPNVITRVARAAVVTDQDLARQAASIDPQAAAFIRSLRAMQQDSTGRT